MTEATEQRRYEFECHYPNACEYRLDVGYSGPYAEAWEMWPIAHPNQSIADTGLSLPIGEQK